MRTEEVEFLEQLIASLEKAEQRLEETYKKGDYADFDRIKEFISQIQKKILGVLK